MTYDERSQKHAVLWKWIPIIHTWAGIIFILKINRTDTSYYTIRNWLNTYVDVSCCKQSTDRIVFLMHLCTHNWSLNGRLQRSMNVLSTEWAGNFSRGHWCLQNSSIHHLPSHNSIACEAFTVFYSHSNRLLIPTALNSSVCIWKL